MRRFEVGDHVGIEARARDAVSGTGHRASEVVAHAERIEGVGHGPKGGDQIRVGHVLA